VGGIVAVAIHDSPPRATPLFAECWWALTRRSSAAGLFQTGDGRLPVAAPPAADRSLERRAALAVGADESQVVDVADGVGAQLPGELARDHRADRSTAEGTGQTASRLPARTGATRPRGATPSAVSRSPTGSASSSVRPTLT